MPESSSLHRLSALARRALPESVYGAARALGNLALTPLLFSYYTGHARSALRGRAVDRHGQPVTWYTLPMNELLSAKDFADREILELGGGQSTLWWAARARRVVCLEADPAWYQHLRGLVPANVELHLCTDFAALEQALAGRRFDLVLVDGLDVPALGRLSCARRAQDWITPGGAVLLDNSEGPWSDDGRFRIMDHYRGLRFQRVDFYGFCAGNIAPSCTSIFFSGQAPCFLFSGAEDPSIPYPLRQPDAKGR